MTTPLAVSIQTAAQMTDLSESTIRDAVHTQALPAVKVGRVIRIRTADLDAWLAGQPVYGAPE